MSAHDAERSIADVVAGPDWQAIEDVAQAQERLDAFAACALRGLLASPGPDQRASENPTIAATWAYDFAEAMEAERAKRLVK